MKRPLSFLLVSLLIFATPTLALADQAVYWTLQCEAELYASASENAMILAVASAGQIVLLKAEQPDGWVRAEYVDDWTGTRFDGWFNVKAAASPPEIYDHTLANAQTETAEKLENFRSRVDPSSEKPDFAFDGSVREQLQMRCLAVVDSDEAYVRVDMRQEEGGPDVIDHFVVYGYAYGWHAHGRVPVIGRLNATAFDAETKLPATFEGVAPYTLGSPHIRIAPVFRGMEADGFDILLAPTDGLLPNEGGTGSRLVRTGTPHKDLPLMEFQVSDTGRRSADDRYILQLQITAQDGSLSQILEYDTADPEYDYGFFQLIDVNFDGYMDLDLIVSQGATNWVSIVSVWLPDERRFSEPQADVRLCNYTLDPQRREIVSSIQDGYTYHEDTRFAWEGDMLIPRMRAESYYTGTSETVGERVTVFSPVDGSATILWDEQYPRDWYAGKYEWVERERHAVLDAVVYYDMLHQNPQYAVVDNVDWVNLRHQERKSSDSIGKINAGETVQILRFGCGEDQGWVRVLWNGRTGYIWHSFLNFRT